MIQSGFAIALTLLLTLVSWLGLPTPTLAQPLATPAVAASSLIAHPSTQTLVMALFSFPGTRPTTIGVKDGKLAVCPGSPNCVSSQAPATDAEHFIPPIAYTISSAEAIAKLKSIVQGMERTQIVTETNDYLYAEFTSKLMGYVDDVEFYIDDAAKTIQVRSASRLGQSDLGVNRKRVEAIRSQFLA